MKKYQVIELDKNNNHAGSKATSDVEKIAAEIGFSEKLYISNFKSTCKLKIISIFVNQWFRMQSWINVYRKVGSNSELLLQHPYRRIQPFRDCIIKLLKKRKNVKIISIIHDIDELRDYYFSIHHRKERILSFKNASVLIVHNESMKQYIMSKRVDESKILVLGIFDYLSSEDYARPEFSKDVLIAGNFEKWKSGYVYKLQSINDVSFQLYGANYTSDKPIANVKYNGVYPADKLCSCLNHGFGLVWDGPDINSCIGPTGNYLKYNNPHKLSLYIASGIPVIVWGKAAIAPFVINSNVGLTIESLKDLPKVLDNITIEEYTTMADNAKNLSDLLRHGYFMKNALLEAEKRIASDRSIINNYS